MTYRSLSDVAKHTDYDIEDSLRYYVYHKLCFCLDVNMSALVRKRLTVPLDSLFREEIVPGLSLTLNEYVFKK